MQKHFTAEVERKKPEVEPGHPQLVEKKKRKSASSSSRPAPSSSSSSDGSLPAPEPDSTGSIEKVYNVLFPKPGQAILAIQFHPNQIVQVPSGHQGAAALPRQGATAAGPFLLQVLEMFAPKRTLRRINQKAHKSCRRVLCHSSCRHVGDRRPSKAEEKPGQAMNSNHRWPTTTQHSRLSVKWRRGTPTCMRIFSSGSSGAWPESMRPRPRSASGTSSSATSTTNSRPRYHLGHDHQRYHQQRHNERHNPVSR